MSRLLPSIALVAASAVMFVVVCPATATPSAVAPSKGKTPMVAELLLVAMVLSPAAAWLFYAAFVSAIPAGVLPYKKMRVLTLICSRLC